MLVHWVGISQRIRYARAHTHSAHEIVAVLEGEGAYTVGDQTFPFHKGDILCIPPGVEHSVTSDTRFKDIYIEIAGFPRVQTVFFHDDAGGLQSLLYLALRTFHNRHPNADNILSCLSEIIYQLLKGKETPDGDAAVEQFKNYVIQNFTDPEFTVAAAYRQVNFCPDYFRRRFKERTGVSPVTYLNDLRIEHAKHLLRKSGGTDSVAEIAYLSGFYDQRYFSQVFRKRTGMTPVEYRQNYDKDCV